MRPLHVEQSDLFRSSKWFSGLCSFRPRRAAKQEHLSCPLHRTLKLVKLLQLLGKSVLCDAAKSSSNGVLVGSPKQSHASNSAKWLFSLLIIWGFEGPGVSPSLRLSNSAKLLFSMIVYDFGHCETQNPAHML